MGPGEEWRDLGRRLGFDPSMDDLAVIAREPDDGDATRIRLLAEVRRVVDGLAAAGHPHAAVAVVADVPRAWVDELFAAGAHVIAPDDSAAFLSGLRTEAPPDIGPTCIPEVRSDADPGAYVGLNPDLTEADVAAWLRRLQGLDEA